MKHPLQKIYFDEHKVARFTKNVIVEYMLNKIGGLYDLHMEIDPDDADWDQLNQLVGYSVSGCPMRNSEAQDAAQRVVEAILDGKELDPRDAYIKQLETQLYMVKKKVAEMASDLFCKAEEDFHLGEDPDE